MWQYQERQMAKMDPAEQQLDPRWQYMLPGDELESRNPARVAGAGA